MGNGWSVVVLLRGLGLHGTFPWGVFVGVTEKHMGRNFSSGMELDSLTMDHGRELFQKIL